MSLIYLRHGDKLYRNGDPTPDCINYAHDSPLSQKGIIQIKEMIPFYLSKYGTPDLIYCSPYIRTRQTAKLIQDHIYTKMKILINIYCDNNLSEYLGNQVTKMKRSGKKDLYTRRGYNINPPDLKIFRFPETENHNPPVEDSFSQFQKRLKIHHSTINEIISKGKKIWLITHGLVITELVKLISSSSIGDIASFKGVKISKIDDQYKIDIV